MDGIDCPVYRFSCIAYTLHGTQNFVQLIPRNIVENPLSPIGVSSLILKHISQHKTLFLNWGLIDENVSILFLRPISDPATVNIKEH